MCGGTNAAVGEIGVAPGLSPRVRGNLIRKFHRLDNPRSIPACAGEPAGRLRLLRSLPVYPRVCGGTKHGWAVQTRRQGLSPRVRGNRRLRSPPAWRRRSIPACAGEPTGVCGDSSTPAVYPRVCGGTSCTAIMYTSARGLSPRVRGNQRKRRAIRRRSWSIPACAGEPIAGIGVMPISAVYPRVCGGTSMRVSDWERSPGLSPRVRGNLHHRPVPLDNQGSIPACAGEPHDRAAAGAVVRVYPRVCGGTSLRAWPDTRRTGLSPRVRGNHASPRGGWGCAGSIPACAGEPPAAAPAGCLPWVYPRVCGGTCTRIPLHVRGYGLSPRVRGNRTVAGNRTTARRSIPACAGEPLGRPLFPLGGEVYPRVCGGTFHSQLAPSQRRGLSPRVRGNPPACSPQWTAGRSIPACAGEPWNCMVRF